MRRIQQRLNAQIANHLIANNLAKMKKWIRKVTVFFE